MEEIKNKLIQWIRDQVGNCTVVIGISGGKDSTVAAAICAEALGKDKVFGVLMPNFVQHDIDKSHEVCELLGIRNITINIGEAYKYLTTEFERAFVKDELTDCYVTNTPARIRMATLYGVAAELGNARVVNTCNLSEDWVGYSTKFGDSAGDFSPLSDLTVQEVKQLGYELNLPAHLIEKVPEDGMSGKSDEEKLGFTYEELDKYIRTGEIENLEHKEKIDRLHVQNLHKLRLMPKFENNPYSGVNLLKFFKDNNLTFATAESLTAGGIGSEITKIPGISEFYKGGAIVYSNEAKVKLLDVNRTLLDTQGPYNHQTVKEMAYGIVNSLGVDCAVAVSGVAGPEPDGNVPAGEVYIGVYFRPSDTFVSKKYMFAGDREEVRRQTVNAALELLVDSISKLI